LRSDGGEVRVAGADVAREPEIVRRSIGLTGQVSAVDVQFTGEENLRLMADLHHLGGAGRARVAELLERFDLVEAAQKPAATYSGGMRRRLDLAMTLMGNPRIIFLDEPTTGLDPRSRHVMWDIVGELVDSGTTVLLTTQYLEEADRLANGIAVLDGGKVVASGTPAELKRLVPGGTIRLEFADEAELSRAAGALGQGTVDEPGLALHLPGDGGVAGLRALLDRLDAEAIRVDAVSVRPVDLDDVFLALTGHAGSQEIA
jgi:ABC-2 type transport system ATP-binding protein